MPRHPPYTLSSLTTFIDHRHGTCDMRLLIAIEELTHADQQPPLSNSSSGRAGNGTNDQQMDHFGDACFAGTRPIRQKGARRLPPDRKTKMGGVAECSIHNVHHARCNEPSNLVIHLSKNIFLTEYPSA